MSDRAVRLVRWSSLIVLALLLAQAPRLLGHVSFRVSVAGRYSYSYALALGGYVVLILAAGALPVFARPVCRALAHHPLATRRGLAMFTGIAVAALIVEIALRLVDPFGLDYFANVDRWLASLDRDAAPLVYRNRAGLRMSLGQIDISISSQGLRDREYTVTKPPGTARILVLGDSVAFGLGVRVEDTYAKQLERLLIEQGQRVEVLNAGVTSYDLPNMALYLRTAGLRFQPDVILVTVTALDFLKPRLDALGFSLRQLILDWLTGAAVRSRIAGLVYMVVQSIWPAAENIRLADQPGWRETRRALADIVADATEAKAKVAIAHFRLEPTRWGEEAQSLLSQECARLNVPCLDHLTVFHGVPVAALRNSMVDAHPNATANRLMAEQWRAFLLERGWLGRPSSAPARTQTP